MNTRPKRCRIRRPFTALAVRAPEPQRDSPPGQPPDDAARVVSLRPRSHPAPTKPLGGDEPPPNRAA
jgi:hypothetical protein